MKKLFQRTTIATLILSPLLATLTGFIAFVHTPTGSMEPTIQSGSNGDTLLMAKPLTPIERGDIVVVDTQASSRWGETYQGAEALKRVVALPGDKVSSDPTTGNLLINGEESPLEWVGSSFPFRPGILDCGSTPQSKQCLPAFTIPEGHVLLLGDNRAESKDSLWGCRGEDDPSLCLGAFPMEGIELRSVFL